MFVVVPIIESQIRKIVEKLQGSELSVKRVRFVYKYLYFKGIQKDRMTYYGYDFQLPILF